MTREAIADILEKIALLLELQGENTFKIRAYNTGAEIVRSHPEDIIALAKAGNLTGIHGLGEALVDKITALATTGRLEFWENLKAPYPESFFELFDVPGLGPKKIRVLKDELNIAGLGALRAACEAGLVAGLPGFGSKTELKLLQALKYTESTKGRAHRDTAAIAVGQILAFLRDHPDVLMAEAAGSFRRGNETVGDLDFLAATSAPAVVCHAFATAPFAVEVIAHGDTKVSIRLEGGLQADLRAVGNAQFPFALQYFTGSKEHNITLRSRARKLGWSLNEYGITPVDGAASPPPIHDEDALYRFFDLDPIPPALRENLGEFEAAEHHRLPRLVEWTDLRGTFHNHTTDSDGTASLEQMAAAAIDLGLQYLGIADHSKAAFQANGLREDRLRDQLARIRKLNAAYARDGIPFVLLAGSEVDILKDGSMDFPDDLLADLDYVVASVHNSFTLPEKEQPRGSSGPWKTRTWTCSATSPAGFSCAANPTPSTTPTSSPPPPAPAPSSNSTPIPGGSTWTGATGTRPATSASSAPSTPTPTRPPASSTCASASMSPARAGCAKKTSSTPVPPKPSSNGCTPRKPNASEARTTYRNGLTTRTPP